MTGAILDHLWQSTLFAGAAGFFTLLLANNSAGARFWLWFAASVKFLIPFAALTALGHFLLTPALAPVPVTAAAAPVLLSIEPVALPFGVMAPSLDQAAANHINPLPLAL